MLWEHRDFWTFVHHIMTTRGQPLTKAPEESHGQLCETLLSDKKDAEYFLPSHV